MRGKLELLRLLQREPNKQFSTTMLVEAMYPQETRSIRDRGQFGSKDEKRSSQDLKSKLHRKTLYHLGRLVEEGVLEIVRVDAHGEKVYRVAQRAVTVSSQAGPIHITQPELKLQGIMRERDSHIAFVYDERSTLSRMNAYYIDCTRVDGLGALTRLLETTLRLVNDVVCLGDFQTMVAKYQLEDLQEFMDALVLETLDEGRSVCIVLDVRATDVAPFVRRLAEQIPRRVYIVFVCDQKSLARRDMLECIARLEERHEKVNVHMITNHQAPVFVGRAGPYGVLESEWQAFRSNPALTGFIVASASIVLDLARLDRRSPAEVRTTIRNATKAVLSIMQQQRLIGTGVPVLKTLASDTPPFFAHASVYLRFWNYDWETEPMVLESVREELLTFAREQERVFRACGLPFHCALRLSCAFRRFNPDLSERSYKKWTVTSKRDLETPAFAKYMDQRARYGAIFDGIDRFRVFRAGSPNPEDIAQELILIAGHGFPLITMDFKPLRGVRRLTEFLG